MRRLTLPAAFAVTAFLAACAPNPIIARDPIPAPGPDAAFACDTKPFVLGAHMTDCKPVGREPQVVVRQGLRPRDDERPGSDRFGPTRHTGGCAS